MSAAIVLGSNADALVAAHLLARAGRRVTLVHPRAFSDRPASWVSPRLRRALALEAAPAGADATWASALLPAGGTLELAQDIGRSVEAIRRLSPRDAERWPQFCERMAALARLLETLYAEPPPAPLDLRLALRVRRLGRRGMSDLLRVLPMSAAELLDDWFECDALKGALAASAIAHLQQGPRSAGTAFRLLHHHVGCAPGVFRPARIDLVAALRERPGVALRAQGIERILIKGGRVTGVALAGGEELAAALVLSAEDARRTLLELADPGWLDPELARAVGHVRRRGVAARLRGRARHRPATAVLAPSLDYLERAYDAVKYGRMAEEPALEARYDGDRVEIDLQFAPYRLADGPWDGAARARLAAFAASRLPELADAPLSVEAPPDLEEIEGWPEGQPFHAELALDQSLWARPLPALARYRTPIEGLWLCGPGMHPGIPGAAGEHCVQALERARA